MATKILFSADDGINGFELWVTDGTAAGTALVKDINATYPRFSSNPTYITAVGNGTAIFQANDGIHGLELWVTDGTAGGTALLKDINPGSADSSSRPNDLTVLGNGKAVFEANDGTHGFHGYGLWVTDGTAAGTTLVKEINPTPTIPYWSDITALGNGTAVFRADDGSHGYELWVTDGTAGGTSLVDDINPGSIGSLLDNNNNNITALGNGAAVFEAFDGTHGDELWVTDGTAAGTALVKDIYPGGGPSNPHNIMALGNGTALFSVGGGSSAYELWVTDGTSAGTTLLKDIYSAGDFALLGNGTVVFDASDGIHGTELWATDGTATGTVMVKDINPTGNSFTYNEQFAPLGNGAAVFEVNDGTHGFELWMTDGTASGTVLVKDINPGSGSSASFPPYITALGDGTALFSANDGTHGYELWVTDGTADGTGLVDDIFPGGAGLSSSPTDFTVLTPVCFCRGTLICTDRGEVAVEELAVGDRVETVSGVLKPIRWIGFGRDLVTRRNSLARPVIVRAGALADDVPRRHLYLTHGHSLYVEGVLIPVEHLINHRSILWDDAARVVAYYHIELDGHDVVFAEGAPAESYYDAGNRALFQNARAGSEAGAATPTYAPVLTGGAVVEKIWAELFARSGGQIEDETSDDPDLHLVVDGERLDPASNTDGAYTFALGRPPAGRLRLRSRSGVPSLIGLGRSEHRRLGVAIGQLILHQPGVMTSIDHHATLFAEGGCHPPERDCCWTDGEFVVPAEAFAHLRGAFTLIVRTQRQSMRYPVASAVAEEARASRPRRVPPAALGHRIIHSATAWSRA